MKTLSPKRAKLLFSLSILFISYTIKAQVPAAALNFDGGNDYITTSSVAFGNNWTVEGWIRPTNINSIYWNAVMGQVFYNNGQGFVIAIYGGEVFFDGPQAGVNMSTPITSGVWTHVAATYNNGVVAFYKDGILVGTRLNTIATSTTNFMIGVRTQNGGSGLMDVYQGDMDEIRIWNTTRTQCEILQYMNCEVTSAAGLLSAYHFNQGFYNTTNTGISTLTDAAGSRNGALSNFAYTGLTSNWTAPGAVITGSTTPFSPLPEITVRGNANVINDGAVASSLTNHTDFGTSLTRSFVVQSTGTHTLNLGQPFFTGANPTEFSLTPLASTVLAAGTGTTSFAIALTPTAFGAKSAQVTIYNSDCSEPFYDFVITATAVPGAALSFDGVDDYVETNANLAELGPADFTIEAWIKTTGVSQGIVTCSNGNTAWEMGEKCLYLDGGGVPNFVGWGNNYIQGNIAVNDGNWHHIAVTWNSSVGSAGIGKMYVDGVDHTWVVSYTGNYTNVGTFKIGRANFQAGEGLNYFNGHIDEVRIWNRYLCQAEIQNNMNCELPGPASYTGLNGYYQFNSGMGNGPNAMLTFALDAGFYNNSGILTNFALNGVSSNWTAPGGVVTGAICSAYLDEEIDIRGNSTSIVMNSATPSATNHTQFGDIILGSVKTRTFVIHNTGTAALSISSYSLSGPDAGSFTIVTNPAATLPTGGSSPIVITFSSSVAGLKSASLTIGNSDCDEAVYSFAINANGALAGSALNFDGVNDVVNCGTDPSLDITTGTWETWVNLSNLSNSRRLIYKEQVNGSATGSYELFYSQPQTKFVAELKIGATNYSVTGVTTPVINTWYHVAATYDGVIFKLYVNGILENMRIINGGPMNPGTGYLSLGAAYSSPTFAPLNGSLDETRVWNVVRTQCEIQSFMNCEIPSSAPGLLINYHFNQGANGVANPTETVAFDGTGSNNGTLGNFTLNGPTSNWIAPGPIANGYTTSIVPTSSLTLSGNGNNIPMGSATSTTNFTDFSTNTSRSFVITNPGASVLYINGGIFSGANASNFSITTLPSTVITGGGSSSFVISFTPSAVGSQSAILTLNSSDCTSPNYSFVITASTAPASALNFDGVNDYVSINYVQPVTEITNEFWFKTSNGNQGLFTVTDASTPFSVSGWDRNIYLSSGNLYAYVWDGGPNEIINTSGTNFADGNWHHVAHVIGASQGGQKLYVDGLLRGSGTLTASGFNYNTHILLGFAPITSTTSMYYTGSLDEVRMWTVARSQCEIQSYMNCEIPGTLPGLAANYHFNQGIPSGPNASYSVATDAAAAHQGILTGFALSGSTSNWVIPGSVISGYTTLATPAVEIDITGNGSSIPDGNTSASAANFTDFNGVYTRTFVIQNTGSGTLNIGVPYFTGPQASHFSLSTLPASTLGVSGTTSMVIVYTPTNIGVSSATLHINNNDCSEPVYDFAIQANGIAGSAIAFDGVDDYIDLGNSATLKPNTALTAEAWVYSSNWPGTDQTILGNTENNGYGLFTRTTGMLEGLVRRNSTWGTVTTPLAAITPGWHHVSMTYDGQFTRLYLDGVLKSTDDAGSIYSIDYNPGNNTLIGGEASGGAAVYPGWFFTGKVDEVRIWNRALCQAEVQHNMNCEISVTGNGLVANYHFNEGIASGYNPTVTTLPDLAGGSLNGTLQNMSRVGSASNWVSPGAVTSGSSCSAFVSPEINLVGNGQSISDGDISPSSTDDTDFGAVCSNSIVVKTFTIQNNGTSALTINTMSMSGANAALFTIGALSPASPVAIGNTAVFSVTFAPGSTGVKTATLNISNSDCNEDAYDFAVTGTSNAIPTVSAGISSSVVCEGTAITLTGAGADTYTWTGGVTNALSFTPVANQSYTVSGTYTLTGCTSTNLATRAVTVNLIPTVSISTPTAAICSGNAATLTASGANTYTWNPGTLTGGTISPSPGASTSYTLVGTSTAGCTNTNTATQLITVHITPTLSATSGSSVICESFSATLSVSGADTYTWQPGSFTNGTITVTPATSTDYTVLGYSNQGCISSNSIVRSVTVNALPTVTASTTQSAVCDGFSTTLLGNGADTYTWSPPVTNGVPFVPAASTNYTLAGTYTLTGCTSTNLAVQSILVDNIPTVSISSGSTICDGSSATLTATGADTYTWEPGTTIASSIVVSPSSTTIYTLTGTSLAGCTSTNPATRQVSVNPLPTVTASVSHSVICENEIITVNGSGAQTYTWTGGVSDATPFSPTSSASYTLSGTDLAGCTSTNLAVADVTVNVLPTVSAGTTNSVICNGFTTSVSGSGADTYTWSPLVNDGIAFTPTITTSYTVTGTNTLTGCTSTNLAVQTITVDNTPTVSISSGSTICDGNSATLTASGALTYTWEPGTVIASSIVVSPSSTTIYTLTGTNLANCTSTNLATQQVSVNPLPTVTASISKSVICLNQSVTVNGSGATTYTWSGGVSDGTLFAPAATGSYTLSGTDLAGCTSTNIAVAFVTVNALPSLTVAASNPVICTGAQSTLTASGADTYTWSGQVSNGVAFSPTVTTAYTVTATNLNTCSNTAVAGITVNALPVLTVTSAPLTSCEAETTTITVSGANSYTWNTGGLTNGIVISPTATTIYSVNAVDINGCANATSYTQAVIPCPGSFTAAVIKTDISCRGKNDGKIVIDASSSYTSSVISYIWDPSTLCPGNDCDTISNLQSGTYNVTVRLTYTLNSILVKTDSIILGPIILADLLGSCDIKVFNGVTANGDGINDILMIENIDQFPKNTVTVYNRWGQEVYKANGYNNLDKAWPLGSEANNLLPNTYFYVIDPGDGTKLIKGWIEFVK